MTDHRGRPDWCRTCGTADPLHPYPCPAQPLADRLNARRVIGWCTSVSPGGWECDRTADHEGLHRVTMIGADTPCEEWTDGTRPPNLASVIRSADDLNDVE